MKGKRGFRGRQGEGSFCKGEVGEEEAVRREEGDSREMPDPQGSGGGGNLKSGWKI